MKGDLKVADPNETLKTLKRRPIGRRSERNP